MRKLFPVLVLLLALIATPARADITAEYHVWGPLGPSMKVQVSAGGEARVEMGGRLAALRRAGIFYLIREDEQGTFLLPLTEFWRIEAEEDSLPELPAEVLASLERAELVELGEEVVGGRRGVALGYREEDGTVSDRDMAFVVSSDPDLRPVGDIVSQVFFGLGLAPGPMARQLAEIARHGTLIRMWFMIRLERTSDAPIPASAFKMDAPVLTGEQARARLGSAW